MNTRGHDQNGSSGFRKSIFNLMLSLCSPMGTSKSGSPEEAVDDGRVLVKEGCGGAWGHSGAVKAGFRSQEHFQKREVKIHQMGRAHTAKMMPQSVWK